MWRVITAVLVSLCLVAGASAQLNRPAPGPPIIRQPPQSVPQTNQQQPVPDLRGTEGAPVVVKVLPAPKSEEEAAQDKAERESRSSADRWMVRLTGLVALIGAIQAIVFWIQADRLKKTIKKMDEIASGQTADMQASINEASRAAEAMERISDSIRSNVVTTTTMFQNQREFWQKQMRAYVYPQIGAAIYQDRANNIRFEAKPRMVNFGNTPAHNVRYRAKAAILPIPIPGDFKYPLTGEYGGGSVMGPHANFIMNALVEDLVPDQDVEAIKQGRGRALATWGTIEYSLVTGEVVHTNFCQIYTWLPNGSNWGYYTPAHNDAT